MEEELESVAAIYDDVQIDRPGPVGCVAVISAPLSGGIRLRIALPTGYPAVAAQVELHGLPKGQADVVVPLISLAESMVGEPAVFAVVSAAREAAQAIIDAAASAAAASAAATGPQASPGRRDGGGGAGGQAESVEAAAEEDREWAAAASPLHSLLAELDGPIVSGEAIIDRKSVFVAHMARVHSKAQVRAVLGALLSNSKIARATHNIQAYRFRDERGALIADCDDDGEDAAGGKLAELLQLMRVDNVFVMVSRWYGGILLGPDRFKHINNAARRLIESAPWYEPPAAHGGSSSSKGKR